jgi:hypothetical protein
MDFSVVSTVIPVFRLFEPGRVSVNVFNEEKPIASMKGRRLAGRGRRLDRLLAQRRTHKVYNNRCAVPFLSFATNRQSRMSNTWVHLINKKKETK